MSTESSVTETVVRNHLQAFLEQKGIAAILNDYDENARFYSEAKIYQGKQEIHGFFSGFHRFSTRRGHWAILAQEPASRRQNRLYHLERRQ